MPNDHISYFARAFAPGQFAQLQQRLSEVWGVQPRRISVEGSIKKPDKVTFALDEAQLSQIVELTDERLHSVTFSLFLGPAKQHHISIYATGGVVVAYVVAPSWRSFVDSVHAIESELALERVEPIGKDDAALWKSPASDDGLEAVIRVCERFHGVTRLLGDRRAGHPVFSAKDEYDVQYLFRALLGLFFDDIRPEEGTPTHAGAASRMDFLLKNERIVVETKRTRKGLDAKALGEELIVDTERYSSHPDCQHLICFVYDPDGLIGNPSGMENDLSGLRSGIDVQVVVRPR